MSVKTNFRSNLAIRVKGKGVSPESVPFVVISSIVASIQSIIAGRAVEEENDKLRLLQFRRGSVNLHCYYPQAELRVDHLSDVKNSIADQSFAAFNIAFAIGPLEALSAAAKRLNATIEIGEPNGKRPLLTIDKNSFAQFSRARFVSGFTTVVGTLIRVGGRKDRCVVQAAGEKSLLYCDVKGVRGDDELLKRLSQRLRERVILKGVATWLRNDWSLQEFTVTDLEEKENISIADHIRRLHKIGGRRWGSLKNPKEYAAKVLGGG